MEELSEFRIEMGQLEMAAELRDAIGSDTHWLMFAALIAAVSTAFLPPASIGTGAAVPTRVRAQ